MRRLTKREESLTRNMVPREAADEFVARPFTYRHFGSLAYIGNAAVFDLGKYSFMGGLVSLFLSRISSLPFLNGSLFDLQWAMYAWRSVYFSEQVSTRTKALLMADWIIRGIWGRDLSRL